MYLDHVPKIAAAMHACPDTFAAGIMFAVLSARVPFVRVPEMLLEIAEHGKHAAALWRETCAAKDSETAIVILTRIPGMGIVKAGFVLQLLGHDVACLDTRNIQREDRDPRAYRSDGEKRKAMPAFKRKIARYVADVGGKAGAYWDAWCTEIGGIYDMSAEDVSALHLCFVPASLRALPELSLPTVGYHAIPF